MARKIDHAKIDSIKSATMEIIVEKGIENTTIAMIASKSKVSAGYLYRLYQGKDALIESMYNDKVHSLLSELEFLMELNPTSVSSIVSALVKNRILYAQNEPIGSQFFYRLIHNTNFILSPELKSKNTALISKLKNIGVATGEISEDISILDIQYHMILYIVNYLHFHKSNFLGIDASEEIYADKLIYNVLTILKNTK